MEDHSGSSGGLREGKMYSFDGGMKVPLIAMWASYIPSNTRVMLIAQNLSDLTLVSSRLDKAGINYLLPVRDSKENTQYKEAIKNNVDYVINCSENTIKNINNNESIKFNISNLRKLL